MPANKPKKVKKQRPKAKITFRKNFLPPLLGISITLIVFGLLNSQLLAAKLLYSRQELAPISYAPPAANASTTIPDGPALIKIPKLNNLEAPIVFEPSTVEYKIQLALREGVVHFGGTALPGQDGNVVLFGHSSGQLWAPGNYKFVFTLLDKLEDGDIIVIDYQKTRYTYKVKNTQVVLPNAINVLQPTKTPTLTLITCSPVGTSNKRLIVTADQISPKPAEVTSTAKPEKLNQVPVKLPSNTPSIINSIKDLF